MCKSHDRRHPSAPDLLIAKQTFLLRPPPHLLHRSPPLPISVFLSVDQSTSLAETGLARKTANLDSSRSIETLDTDPRLPSELTLDKGPMAGPQLDDRSEGRTKLVPKDL